MTLTDPSRPVASSTPAALAAASEPIVRSLLAQARGHHAELGVLGIRARLEWGGAQRDFAHDGRAVHVELCRSSLAVRAALGRRDPSGWLVIVTDRTDDDLGLGITSRLAFRRLRSADPWEPVKISFAANRIDYRLVGESRAGREVAVGLLLATPADGWPPAPAGVLTADHAYGAVAAILGLGGTGPMRAPVDEVAVLAWSAGSGADQAITDLRARAGVALTDAVLRWCASRAGALADPWGALLKAGRAADLVPLGLVLSAVLASPADAAARTLLRRAVGGQLPTDAVLSGWATAAQDVTQGLLADDPAAAARILARADRLLDEVEAGPWVDASDVLDQSLRERLRILGGALRAGAAGAEHRAATAGPDSALISPDRLAAVEQAWSAVERHALARRRPLTARAEAGVRLARWLAAPAATWDTPVDRHRRDDAWIDRATAAAWVGVDDDRLAQGLRTVLGAVRLRRDDHDRSFAAALAATGGRWERSGVVPVEQLLAGWVLPLAGAGVPLLLVVADGMSAANAGDITDDVVNRYDGWLEHIPDRLDAPLSAISALPSITEVSRASLLCGEITSGDQTGERRGFDALCRSQRVTGQLFHKRPLDSSEAGFALAHDVADAIDRTDLPVVACVLNTIDDALDRSDPGGTDWTADTVKHLGPLLDRARRAGRTVVLTSDHGHVIERRDGRVAAGSLSKGNRWRSASGPCAGDGEVLVHGDRVAADGSAAVLAVDERLRYSALKAGYHGGAAPAEVVIPVVVLAAGSPPPGWRPAPPQTPAWWRPAVVVHARAARATARARPPTVSETRAGETPSLFDAEEPSVDLARPDTAGDDLAATVLACAVYRQQRVRAARVTITDDKVGTLLRACLRAAAGAIDEVAASRALDVAAVQLAGAIGQVQRLLNVEQYPVLTRDTERREVMIDAVLLREQFGLTS